jgi:plasmid stability protein
MLADTSFDCMASISVRKLDDKTVAVLRNRAARHGVSMEEEVRRILEQIAEGEENAGDMMMRIFERSRLASGEEPFVIPEYDERPEEPVEFDPAE